MTSAAQQTALEGAVARVVYFVEFHFASGVQRISTAMMPLSWGGYDWLGLGTLGDISAVEETGGMAPRSVVFTLNVAQQSWLALALGAAEEYRARRAVMYMCPLDVSFQMIGEPVRCWVGKMQTMSVGGENEGGQIRLTCESSAFDLKRQSGLRLNAVQHKKNHPTDLGLDFQDDLVANPQTWLSKNFQER